jgi:hypothetical protein
MGVEALFRRDDGTPDVPRTSEEWDGWVSASRTRNYLLDDPLLDWLSLYGEAKGFERDAVDPRTDFGAFVMRKGVEFEAAVMRRLTERHDVMVVAKERGDARSEEAARRAWGAMAAGREVIAQAPVRNPQTRTYGVVDLLVRSDVLERMFPGTLGAEAETPAPDLPGVRGHYRVLDVKFSTLELLVDGHAGGGHLHYAAQVWLYNEALGRLQGFTPGCGYLLGRAWKQRSERGRSALERVCRVDRAHERRSGETLAALALSACEWVRRVRREGARWDVLPTPSVPELRPNLRHGEDAPWHRAKQRIAAELCDLTQLPLVAPDRRDAAVAAGLSSWKDPACSARRLGITGDKRIPLVDAVIAAAQSSPNGPHVFPARVESREDLWREPAPLELYVDFETVSDVDDDFSAFPEKGGNPMIFMVGCGWTEPDGAWRFEVFTADRLVPEEERRILDAWLGRMRGLCAERGRLLCEGQTRIYHWSPAEVSTLETAYNSAVARHESARWTSLPWVDLLGNVVKAQPVTVRGAFGFGLKAVTRALHAAKLIESDWPDGVADGLGAMVGAWWCDAEARRVGGSMRGLELMRQIEAYNRVDVEAMRDVLAWLRANR